MAQRFQQQRMPQMAGPQGQYGQGQGQYNMNFYGPQMGGPRGQYYMQQPGAYPQQPGGKGQMDMQQGQPQGGKGGRKGGQGQPVPQGKGQGMPNQPPNTNSR